MATKKKKEEPKVQTKETKSQWFKTGQEGVQEKVKQDKLAEMKKEKSVWRFRLNAGESAKLVFVDDLGLGKKLRSVVTC